MTELNGLINVTEAADIAGVSRQGFYGLIKAGVVKPTIVAGRQYFQVAEMRMLKKARMKLRRSTPSK